MWAIYASFLCFSPGDIPTNEFTWGKHLEAKILSEHFIESKCLTCGHFCFRHFSKNDLVIHLVLGQKGTIKPSFLTENGKAGEAERDSLSQKIGRNIAWVHSWVYFRKRKNTLIDKYLRTEWRLLSSMREGEGKKSQEVQEVYSLASAMRKGRERKHRPSQDLREHDTFSPVSQVKWDRVPLLCCYHSGVSGLLCGFCDAFWRQQNTKDCTLPLFLSCFLSSIVVR